jgi:hypothetical protein
MARLRHTTRKSVIPFLPSHLAGASASPHSDRLVQSHGEAAPPLPRGAGASAIEGATRFFVPAATGGGVYEASLLCTPTGGTPCPTPGRPAAGGADGGDLDGDDDDGGSSSHSTTLSEELEPEGWIGRLITRDAARGCHFHDALDTLLRQAMDRHTWSIEYHCVVYQHSLGLYLDHWEATRLVRRPEDDLQGVEVCSEHYSISERDTAEAAMQDAALCGLSLYCSLFSGVADGLNLKYYPRRSTGSIGSVIVSPVGEGNPRLNSVVNLVTVLNIEPDHSLDELSRAHAKIAELCAEHAKRHHQEYGSPAPAGIQHPYCSPP